MYLALVVFVHHLREREREMGSHKPSSVVVHEEGEDEKVVISDDHHQLVKEDQLDAGARFVLKSKGIIN